MTNSAKWAWYAPGNLGYEVIFATLDDCVESAVQGVRVTRPLPRRAPAQTSAPATHEGSSSASPTVPGDAGAAGATLIKGKASGLVLALDEPLSFWGGVREHDGRIIDVHHPQQGHNVAGKVLVMPGGRGSSSSSSVLAELVRGRVAPAGIVLRTPDPILALGAMVGELLYERTVPMRVLPPDEYAAAQSAAQIRIDGDAVQVVSPS
ncbi:MAG: DUF126 domain-containing protein [Gemmatimonadetes bacterium]|nr:DUF126 domain-containing protein [Gemmatimonadota bacterium]